MDTTQHHKPERSNDNHLNTTDLGRNRQSELRSDALRREVEPVAEANTRHTNGKETTMAGTHTITSTRGIQLFASDDLTEVQARYNTYRAAHVPCKLRIAIHTPKPSKTHLEQLTHCLDHHQSYTWARLSETVEAILSQNNRRSLGQLAVGLEIPILRSESKQSVADAIRRLIYTRKESFQRTAFSQSSVSFG